MSWNQDMIDAFRASGGDVPRFGRNLVLLHHIGAKSGTEYVTPAVSIREDNDTWLVTASNGGATSDPKWYSNLLAHPDIRIETPDGDVDVHAENLTGAARDAGWQRFKALGGTFPGYEQSALRVIPVLALHRRTS